MKYVLITTKLRVVTMSLILLTVMTGMSTAESIKGLVTDKASGHLLEGATVILSTSDLTIEARTNEHGEYEFKDVQPDTYHLEVSFLGFATRTINEKELSTGQNLQLDVDLSPAAINLESLAVTASRKQEKLVDAPASVSVVRAEEIAERGALSPTDHVEGVKAVDIAKTGLNHSNVVVRGFNNIFSGALLVLTDNRIARVPSLRYNAYNFIPTTNEDIERIEIVSGPGSALYGPNSASGVMHIITKSPFTWQGTTVTVGGGEREIGMTSIRHAGLLGEKIGFKLTGQYYQGLDWKHSEDKEKFERDFNIEKMSGEGRFDFILGDNTTLILNGGINQASGIELTGLGAGQAIDWRYGYAQARVTYKDLYVQTFTNMSNAGDTYLLNTGDTIADNSKLYVAQVQHSYRVNERHRLTYGIDLLQTRPNTDSTINGRNEDDDDINELGAYVQSESKLSEKLKFVGAARIDDNNRLSDMVFSPRAALVFKPRPSHTIRGTFNRAYDTPDNNNWFLDLLTLADLGDIGASFGNPTIGFNPAFDIRVQGVPQGGFHWRMGDAGPAFRSPFAALDPRPDMDTDSFIDFNDPIFTNVMWGVGRTAVLTGAEQLFTGVLIGAGIDPLVAAAQASALRGAADRLTTLTLSSVTNALMVFDPNAETFVPFDLMGMKDIDPLKPTITQTFELGYNGIVGSKLALAADLYYTKKNDFIGPLTIETPNVFLDPTTLSTELFTDFATTFANPANAADTAALAFLDTLSNPALPIQGNNNGTIADEMTSFFTTGAASIPFGTVSPEEAYDSDAIIVTYRNFGDIDFFGADLSFSYHLNENLDISGTYSWVSDIFWEKSAEQPHDINLNAPKHKVSLAMQYHNPRGGYSAGLRARWVDGFQMASPYVGTNVPAYRVFDLNLGYDIPTVETRLTVTIQNLFDHKHFEFVGGANLGRLAIARLTKSF